MILEIDPRTPENKRCRDCGEVRPASEFWRRKKSPDGLALYCKPCFGRRNGRSYRNTTAKPGRASRPYAPRRVVPEGSKFCPGCETMLPVEAFVRNASARDGIGGYCRPCQNRKSKESLERNHGTTRHYHLKRRYGIGASDVVAMLRAQGWHCPVCWTELTEKTAHVDHDHKTGAVRAVVCFNCNGGLGQFKDNVALLRTAAAYLEGDVWRTTQVAPGVYQLPFSPPAALRSPTSSATTHRISSPADVRRLRPR